MRIYATRRECEILLSCLYNRMRELSIDEVPEYNRLASRIVDITEKQCQRDHSKYVKEGKEHGRHQG